MTAFEILTLTTDRLRLRAFCAGDLGAYAAMRASPEVVRYLGTGRTSTPVEVWRMMVGFLGQWALRGYGVWACEKIDGGAFIVALAFSTRSTGRNRRSSIRSTNPFGARASRPKQRGRPVTGSSSTFLWPGLRVSFGPTISHRNASWRGSERFTSAHPSRVVPALSVGCTTGRREFDPSAVEHAARPTLQVAQSPRTTANEPRLNLPERSVRLCSRSVLR